MPHIWNCSWPQLRHRAFTGFTATSLLLASILPVAAFAADESQPTNLQATIRKEQAGALPLTAFYANPQVFEKKKPGTLLRKEAFTGYSVLPGMKAVRILYRSIGEGSEPVVTSGVVLLPPGKAPKGGWPIIAWAHGTSGVARSCAPSLMRNVYYGDLGLPEMLKAGFAVVATDYHGLGTEGPHRYMDKTAQAQDVIYSIPAARAAVPSLARDWVVVGHSQGGAAAWGVAELQNNMRDTHYKGAVAVGAATHLEWMRDHPESTTGAGFYLAWHAYAVHTRYPQFQVSDMLSPVGLSHYEDVTTKGCFKYGIESYHGVEAPEMLKAGWKDNQYVRTFYHEISAGRLPIRGSLLAIAGAADRSVPLAGVKDTIERACGNHLPIRFSVYPGLDHGPVMGKSMPEQLDWIRARLKGVPEPGNCPGS
jgi:pimeloyl-ACP methyl ester carboxylesterase